MLTRARADPRGPHRRARPRTGYPCYTTSAGWLGYSDEKLRRLLQEAVDDGYRHVKLKVGADRDDDIRRLQIAREVIGSDAKLMIDANQVWDVPAGDRVDRRARAEFDLYWIEEPTSPDDVLGHAAIRKAVAPIGVATGEHGMNRVLFKQMFQAEAIDFCQLDSRPPRQHQRDPRRLPDGQQVRRAGVPARRRRRAVRARAAPVDLRLRRRVGVAREPRHRVRRSPARALRRPVHRSRRRIRPADRSPATARRCSRRRSPSTRFPTGSYWSGRSVARPHRDGLILHVVLDDEQVVAHRAAARGRDDGRVARRGWPGARHARRAPGRGCAARATAGRAGSDWRARR